MTAASPDSSSPKSAPVLVTGASGYLGSWIVKKLLEQGHTVHATVRDPARATSVSHLKAVAAQSPGTLKLFKADLLQPGSFVAAMQGCGVVIHTASPFVITGITDPQRELVDPALQGTRNVLDAVDQTPSVKRVVLTSSVAAIYGDNADGLNLPGRRFDETVWNRSSSLHHQPYSYSKTVAEEEAWKRVNAQTRWQLVTINPGLIFGPALSKGSQSGSIDTLKQFGNGTLLLGAPDLHLGVVDVQDVAEAHVRAAFAPQANGRYIVNERSMSLLEMGQTLRARLGRKYPFPTRLVPKMGFWLVAPVLGHSRRFVQRNVGIPIEFDNRRSREELGLQYHDVREALVAHFQQLVDYGIVRQR